MGTLCLYRAHKYVNAGEKDEIVISCYEMNNLIVWLEIRMQLAGILLPRQQ